MNEAEQLPGVLADAENIKKFVESVIRSNQSFEQWNRDNQEKIDKAELVPRKKVPLCIWGPHGIGKTDLLKMLAAELTEKEGRSHSERWLFTSISPAQFEEMGDLLGMPTIDPGLLEGPSDDKTILVPPDWTPFKVEQTRFEEEGVHGPGIFLIDDMNRADIRIISGIMQLLQDYQLASWSVPEGWHIVLTANPPGGEYVVRELDDAVMTRMLHIQMRYDGKAWARWAESQGIDPRGISFVLGYPELITGKRTTPRTLVQFFNAIESVPDLTDDESTEFVLTVGRSCLDPETVGEFMYFMKNDWTKIIQPEEILSAKKFEDIEKRVNALVRPKQKKGKPKSTTTAGKMSKSSIDRVDLANIITQRLVNKILLMQEPFTQAQRDNVVRFLKLELIPLDLRVAAGRDLYKFAIKAPVDQGRTELQSKNLTVITTIFEDATLAKDILRKM